MQNLRREDLSLHHYLKNNVLRSFIETEYSVSFVYLDAISDSSSYVYEADSNMDPLPNSKSRGWVHFDYSYSTTEQSASVTVYDSVGTVISGSNYMIDYIDGRVIFPDTTYVPSHVTYKWNYVALVNEWSDVEAAYPPVVVVEIAKTGKSGFQLGGGKMVSRRVDLHVFASNTAERDDIAEALYDGVYNKCCPYQEFQKGTSIDWDGTFNDNYLYTTMSGASSLRFEDVEARNVNPPLLGIPNWDVTPLSDLNRYRARVSFNMFHWVEA